MSTDSRTKTPLITYGRYLDGNSVVTVWGFLVMFGLIVLWINDSMQRPTPYVWPLIPSVIFIVGALTIGIAQTGKRHINKEKSAENISSYLRENYDLIVDPSVCAVYCDVHPVPNEKIINAEHLESGENVRITLEFSDDLTSVKPALYDSTLTPLSPTKRSDLANA